MVARIAGARNRLSSRAVDARSVVIGMALLCACGASAPRLSRFATALPRRPGASSFDEPTRALFERSLGDRPTRERVHARLELLAMAPDRLSADEARALLESTLDWLDWVRRGEVPDWVEVSTVEPVSEYGDILGELSAPVPTAFELVAAAVRGTHALLARGAPVEIAVAWRAAVRSLHGTSDECDLDGEQGALAAAVEELADRGAHALTGPPVERTFYRASVACHVAMLDGGVRFTRDDGEPFASSCWARGGEPEARCENDLADPSLPDERVVVLLVGGTSQAERVVVVWRDGAWRVVSVDLAWTT